MSVSNGAGSVPSAPVVLTVNRVSAGSVVAWGNNDKGQTEVPAGLTGVTAIAAGANNTVVLVIPTAPTITTQPASRAVAMWQSTSFTVAAARFPLSYQWRQDGADIAGATGAT